MVLVRHCSGLESGRSLVDVGVLTCRLETGMRAPLLAGWQANLAFRQERRYSRMDELAAGMESDLGGRCV